MPRFTRDEVATLRAGGSVMRLRHPWRFRLFQSVLILTLPVSLPLLLAAYWVEGLGGPKFASRVERLAEWCKRSVDWRGWPPECVSRD